MKRIAFLGTGEMAEIVYLGVVEWKLELVDVFECDKHGQTFMGVDVQPLANLPSSTAERVVICVYDRKHPMTANYLPDGVQRDPRMVWVFSLGHIKFEAEAQDKKST